jgi:hypothetical protein
MFLLGQHFQKGRTGSCLFSAKSRGRSKVSVLALPPVLRGFDKESAFKSAKSTTDSSPALYCWVIRGNQIPVRETDG